MSDILIADDEQSMLEMLQIMLEEEGYKVHPASNSDEASALLGSRNIDIVITDMRMPTEGGLGVLKESLKQQPDRPVIMVTAYASAEDAVEAMKLGAFDYITKPFNVDEMKMVVRNAVERFNLLRENRDLKTRLKQTQGVDVLVGKSRRINGIKDIILRVASTDASVLITGESGTGKELIARALHVHSERAEGPFVTINCGAVSENLLESELFGHVKGSFTGAVSDKQGLMESANGGTFFLDEIAEMPLPLQVKLVRALQEREVRRVGDVKDRPLDVRFIAATNRDITEDVNKGRFRQDLYYRLNVVHIDAPPLRERREDIPILAAHFLARLNARYGRNLKGFRQETMKMLEDFMWRGNVRELENVVERAAVLETERSITPDSLPEQVRNPALTQGVDIPDGGLDLEKRLEEIEKSIIIKALEKTGNSRKECARLLNLNQRSLRYKIGKYGIKG